MAKKIDWVESKSPDWKVISVTDENGLKQTSVSANRKDKSGKDNSAWFENITPSAVVEGNLWQNPTSGKWSFYPPKDPLSNPPRRGSSGMAQAVAAKQAGIEKSMAQKEDAIRTSSTARDATLILTTFYPEIANIPALERPANIKLQWNKIRKFLLEAWEPVESVDDHGGRYEEDPMEDIGL